MNLRLQAKVAVVTGAARGIGKAIAGAFLEEGAKVFLVDANEDNLAETLEELSGRFNTSNVVGLHIDITGDDAPARIMQRAVESLGRVDILVNNAGINSPGKFVEMSREKLAKVFAVNFFAPYYLTQEFLRCCIAWHEEGRGDFAIGECAVVNMASIMATEVDSGLSAYCSSKAALARLTDSISRELAPKYGIRAVTVAPGFIDTELLANLRPQDRERIEGRTHLRRLGRAEEIARLVVFLASPLASYMTGSEVRANAGYKP